MRILTANIHQSHLKKGFFKHKDGGFPLAFQVRNEHGGKICFYYGLIGRGIDVFLLRYGWKGGGYVILMYYAYM